MLFPMMTDVGEFSLLFYNVTRDVAIWLNSFSSFVLLFMSVHVVFLNIELL